MFSSLRLFFEDNSTEGAGGTGEGGPAADTQHQQQSVNTTVNVLKPMFSEEELKDYGFDTPDQLKQHLAETKANRVPDDVKKKQAEIEKADFLKVSTEEGLMTVDEYTAYEAITKRPDRELVYEKFAVEFKEDNPEATDELVHKAFETEYKLDSDNAKVKGRGEARLKKEATEARSEMTGKYNSAKEFHDNYRISQKEEPAFKKFINDLVQELTPDTYTVGKAKDDEDELEIPVKFTKEQRDEIAKLFTTPKTFADYLKNKDKLKETLGVTLTKKINAIIKVNNFDSAISHAFTEAKKIGLKKGSTVGAEQQFAMVRNTPSNRMEISKSAEQELNDSDIALRKSQLV